MSSTNHQCSFSPYSPSKTSVSHCRRSISFPTGLSWFFVYAWVAMSGVPAHISVLYSVLPSPPSSITLSVSSVLLLPAVSSLSWLTPVVVPAHISVLSSVLPSPSSSIPVSVSSVLLFPAVSSLSWFTTVVVTLLHVSAPLLPIVVRQPSPSCIPPSASVLTLPSPKTATSVHPLHVKTNPSALFNLFVTFVHILPTCILYYVYFNVTGHWAQ